MVQIAFSVSWQQQLSRNLRVLVQNIADMEWFYNSAIDIVEKRTDEVFAWRWQNVEKNPSWKALAFTTQDARARRMWYYKREPNRPSIMRWTWRLQEDRKREVHKDHGMLAFNAPYAQYHQSWWWRLPRRAIIDLDNKTNAEIVRAMQKKINDDIGIFGLQT